MILAAAIALGLAWGSFANVIIARVPAGEEWVRTPSHCPRCGARIAWYDNIPVLSWLWLARRCRHCRLPISGRYPLVEVLVAALVGGSYLAFGLGFQAVAMAYLAFVSVALAVIDIDVHRLPDSIVFPTYGVVGLLLLADAAWIGEWWPVLRAVVGSVALGSFYMLMRVIKPKGMGLGDVKVAGLLGLALGYAGWSSLAVGAFLGPIIGALVVIPGLVAHRVSMKTAVPYGPALIAAAWIGLFAGPAIYGTYVRLLT